MKKCLQKMLSLLLCLSLCIGTALPAFAIGESNDKGVTFDAVLDTNTLTVSDVDQEVKMTIRAEPGATFDGMGMTLTWSNGLTLSSVAGGTAVEANNPFTAAMYDTTNGVVTWGTIDMEVISNVTDMLVATFIVPANTPAGTYTLGAEGIELTDDYAGNTWEDSASVSATLTISAAASTDLYTANISTTATEFTVNDTVAVTVNVGGTTKEFASSEVTLTYDSTYLTFNQDASTLNGAGVDLTVANTIKLVDHGETNAYPAAYVLNFTAKQATTGAADLVTLTDARFSTAENAISSDLIEATGENALSLTIKNADLNVTLPTSGVVTGEDTVPYGEDYTFTAKNNTTYMYYYYVVSATMGGSTVTVQDNGNGTWTIEDVTGDLEINVTETPKTYTVTVNGDSTVTTEEIEKVATSAVDGKATYNTALTYTLPAGQPATDTVDGYHYIATVTVGGTPYTATASDLTYTIAGADVKGDIVITLSKVTDAADSVKVTIKDSNEIQKDGQVVTEFTAKKNTDVTLMLVPETGYTYVINDGINELTINDDNTFTVSVGETAVEITVTKTLDTGSVNVQKYLTLNATNMWLVTINGNDKTEISGKTYSYDGANMFWSSKYEAYCYLVVAETLTVDDAKAKIGTALVEAGAVDVEYNMDVNNTSGKVDANDAQLVYNMYQTKAYDGFTAVDMIKFLEADLNDTVGVDSSDAQVIINKLLNITT